MKVDFTFEPARGRNSPDGTPPVMGRILSVSSKEGRVILGFMLEKSDDGIVPVILLSMSENLNISAGRDVGMVPWKCLALEMEMEVRLGKFDQTSLQAILPSSSYPSIGEVSLGNM